MSSTTDGSPGPGAPAAVLVERRFRAMGSAVHLAVAPGAMPAAAVDDLLDAAEARVETLEQRWSRFRADSELSGLNRGAGVPQRVSAETAAVLALALEGWARTAGRFDPTVLDALVGEGYDRSFELLTTPAPLDGGGGIVVGSAGRPTPEPVELVSPRRTPPAAVPGADRVDLDEASGVVMLPAGVQLDLGGIGKGRTADLVAAQLVADGAAGACVNLGGDVAVAGEGPDDGGWVIAVDDPFRRDVDLTLVLLSGGAVVTSSAARRRWVGPHGVAHHLIDPSTGRPGDAGLVAVTVVAGSAAWGEILAKAAFLAGAEGGTRIVTDLGGEALLVTTAGDVVRTPGFGAFEMAGGDVAGGGT